MSDLFVDNIKHQSSQGSGTITLGASGETVSLGTTAGGELRNGPAFYVYRTTSQSISDNTDTKVTFETEDLDTDNAFDITTNHRFTVPTGKGGEYYLMAQVSAFSTANTLRDVRAMIFKNGSRLINSYFNIDFANENQRHKAAVVTTIDTASAGDYYEMYAYADVGSNVPTLLTDATTPKSISFLGYRLIGI